MEWKKTMNKKLVFVLPLMLSNYAFAENWQNFATYKNHHEEINISSIIQLDANVFNVWARTVYDSMLQDASNTFQYNELQSQYVIKCKSHSKALKQIVSYADSKSTNSYIVPESDLVFNVAKPNTISDAIIKLTCTLGEKNEKQN